MIDKSLFKVTTSVGTLKLFSLAIPLVVETILNQLLGTVNTAVLSGYSQDAVTAVGVANSVLSVMTLVFSVISVGATVAISNYIGAEELDCAKETIFVSVFACGAAGLLTSIVMYIFRYPILSLMNVEGQILEDAVRYFGIRIMIFFIVAISSSLGAVLRCYGHTAIPVFTGFVINVINMLISVFVIRFPQLSPVTGVTGVACACAISQILGFLMSIFFFFHVKLRWKVPESLSKFFLYLKKVLGVGIPAGISAFAFNFSQTITTSFIVLMGTYVLNTRIYISALVIYVYTFGYSLGSANALMTGRLYGARRMEQADMASKQLVRITRVVNLTLSLAVLLFRRPLLSIFTDDARILEASFAILLVDIIAEQARAVSHIYEQALRAIGDMTFVVSAVIVSCFVFGVGLAYLLGVWCGLGLAGCWVAVAVDEIVRGMVTYFRWQYMKYENFRLSNTVQ